MPIVSAGEVRLLRQRLAEARRGKAALVMLDDIGVHGNITADRVRSDLVLGAQMCLAIQLLSGRPTCLLVGLPRIHHSEFAYYSDAMAISNLLKSYVRGGIVAIDRLKSANELVSDAEWARFRVELEQKLQFSEAVGIERTQLRTFADDVYLVHLSTPDSEHLDRVLTRTDVVFEDVVMCAGHLWWTDTPSEVNTGNVSNPLGGPGRGVRSARPGELQTGETASTSDLVLVEVQSIEDLESLPDALAQAGSSRTSVSGLRVRLDRYSPENDGSLDYAAVGSLPSGLEPIHARSAAIIMGEFLSFME